MTLTAQLCHTACARVSAQAELSWPAASSCVALRQQWGGTSLRLSNDRRPSLKPRTKLPHQLQQMSRSRHCTRKMQSCRRRLISCSNRSLHSLHSQQRIRLHSRMQHSFRPFATRSASSSSSWQPGILQSQQRTRLQSSMQHSCRPFATRSTSSSSSLQLCSLLSQRSSLPPLTCLGMRTQMRRCRLCRLLIRFTLAPGAHLTDRGCTSISSLAAYEPCLLHPV